MQTARRRIKRKVHAHSEADALLEKGKRLGREESKVEHAAALVSAQAAFDRDMKDAMSGWDRKEADYRRNINDLRSQVERLTSQFESIRNAYENRDITINPNTPEAQEGLAAKRDELAEFRNRNRMKSGVPNQYIWHGFPVFEICADVKLFVSNEVGRFLSDGRLHAFARAVQQLYETALQTGRVATIISDPISYRGRIGVFVKDGNARDAAAASQVFDR